MTDRKKLDLAEARRLAGIWKSQQGIAGADLKRLLDELPDLLDHVLQVAPQPGLGMPTPRSNDMEGMQREIVRLAHLLGLEVEQASPAWSFSLFLYENREDPHNGHILHISRDRDRALPALAKWIMERLDARAPKARS